MSRSQELGLGPAIYSKYGDPQYIAPEKGDFRVARSSPALKVGFKNFPLNQFGAVSTRLKKLAETPDIPNFLGMEKDSEGHHFGFRGTSVKKLQGLGERSATGMDGGRGILMVKVPEGSLAENQSLMEGEVI